MIIFICTIKEKTTSFRFFPTKGVVVTADEVEDNKFLLVVLACVLERLDVLDVVLSAARKTTFLLVVFSFATAMIGSMLEVDLTYFTNVQDTLF